MKDEVLKPTANNLLFFILLIFTAENGIAQERHHADCEILQTIVNNKEVDSFLYLSTNVIKKLQIYDRNVQFDCKSIVHRKKKITVSHNDKQYRKSHDKIYWIVVTHIALQNSVYTVSLYCPGSSSSVTTKIQKENGHYKIVNSQLSVIVD